MPERVKRTFSLSAQEASFVDTLVASGAYTSGSEVVRAGLQALRERTSSVERWLHEEVVPVYDAMRSDPGRAVSASEVAAAIRARHAERVTRTKRGAWGRFAPEARDDLLQPYDYIAARSGAVRARAYTERILSYCLGFETFPERGTRRDLRPGLRVVGFARRATIAFHVSDNTVTIDRILYRGRDLAAAFPNDQRR